MIYHEYLSVTTPGKCPVPEVDPMCTERTDTCQADGDCSKGQKCCLIGCGNTCANPEKGMSLHYFYRSPMNKVKTNICIF